MIQGFSLPSSGSRWKAPEWGCKSACVVRVCKADTCLHTLRRYSEPRKQAEGSSATRRLRGVCKDLQETDAGEVPCRGTLRLWVVEGLSELIPRTEHGPFSLQRLHRGGRLLFQPPKSFSKESLCLCSSPGERAGAVNESRPAPGVGKFGRSWKGS